MCDNDQLEQSIPVPAQQGRPATRAAEGLELKTQAQAVSRGNSTGFAVLLTVL
jgi:hypothetical protein